MKQIATYQKLRGGYYTPEPIADFLAQWVVQRPDAHVLEPSCGDGILLHAATKTLIERGTAFSDIPELVQGVEFDPQESVKASERLATIGDLPYIPVHNEDFFRIVMHIFHKNAILMQSLGILLLFVIRTFQRSSGNLPFILCNWQDCIQVGSQMPGFLFLLPLPFC